MSGLAAAERQRETQQTNNDGEFASFKQRMEESITTEKALNYFLKHPEKETPVADARF